MSGFTNYTIPIPHSWKQSSSNQTRLTDEQVRDIRSGELTQREYGKKHNKSQSTIADIQAYRSYKDVE